MTWTLFWGVLLSLVGISLILKGAYNKDIPVVRILIGFFFIYFGIKLFVNKDFSIYNNSEDEHVILFGAKTIYSLRDKNEYSVVFAKGVLDFRNIHLPENENIHIKLNTVFGGSEVLLNDSTCVKVNASSAFAGIKMPDGQIKDMQTKGYDHLAK